MTIRRRTIRVEEKTYIAEALALPRKEHCLAQLTSKSLNAAKALNLAT
jgi:hypothetical protein